MSKFITLSELAEINPRTTIPADTIVSFIGMEDVSEKFALHRTHDRNSRELASGYTRFRENDLLFAKITPCMENGKGALAKGLTNEYGLGSTEFHVLRARNFESREFLAQWLAFSQLRLAAEAQMTGSAGQRRVPSDFFDRFQIPDLPLVEQRRIAEILDAMDDQLRVAELITAKLITLEEAMLIDLLETISESSYKRLGDLLVVPPKNGYSPVAASEATGEYMLGLGCLTIRGFVPRQLKHAPVADARLRPFLLRDGDVLISRSNTRELVGLAGLFYSVGSPCYYPDLMMRLVPSDLVSSAYLAIVLNTPHVRRQVMNVASGTSSSMVKITGSIVKSLNLPVPLRSEQDRITSRIHDIRKVIDRELKQLEKLRLFKTALMTDLLTGRIRVPAETLP